MRESGSAENGRPVNRPFILSTLGVDSPSDRGGATIALTVEFLTAARGGDLTATARVLRRGRNICFSQVEVTQPDGTLVAKALVTYKLG